MHVELLYVEHYILMLNTPRIAIDKVWSSVLTHIWTFFRIMGVVELNYYELQFMAVVNFKMFFMAY